MDERADNPFARAIAQRMMASALACVRAQGSGHLLADADFQTDLLARMQQLGGDCVDEALRDAKEALACGMSDVAVATALGSAARFGIKAAECALAAAATEHRNDQLATIDAEMNTSNARTEAMAIRSGDATTSEFQDRSSISMADKVIQAPAGELRRAEGNGYGPLEVLRSAAGYYVGRLHWEDGCAMPGSRESDYFQLREAAEAQLESMTEQLDATTNDVTPTPAPRLG